MGGEAGSCARCGRAMGGRGGRYCGAVCRRLADSAYRKALKREGKRPAKAKAPSDLYGIVQVGDRWRYGRRWQNLLADA